MFSAVAILGTVGEFTSRDVTFGVPWVHETPEECVPNLARRESRVILDSWPTNL
jgi:hypothetical protein